MAMYINKMPKLYTKTGDEGKTSLYDGNRLPKSSIIFDVLGDIDELSSHIGLLYASISTDLSYRLRTIQHKLLIIGSNIATIDPRKKKRIQKITLSDVEEIEGFIDNCESINSTLVNFILPGVNIQDAQCHVCRSVSRRAERSMWKLCHTGEVEIDSDIIKYMNRLSDFFFAFSRNLSDGKEIINK